MNSGCYGYDISKVLISLKIIDTKSIKRKEIKREKKLILFTGDQIFRKILL